MFPLHPLIVHSKNENIMFMCLPPGIQDVGDFVSSVEHKRRYLTQTVAVCQSYNDRETHGFESKEKKYTDKTKLKPALRSSDTKQSVCAINLTVFI